MSITRSKTIEQLHQYLTVNNITEEEFLKRYSIVYLAQGNSIVDLLTQVYEGAIPQGPIFKSLEELADHLGECYCEPDDTEEAINEELRSFTTHWDGILMNQMFTIIE